MLHGSYKSDNLKLIKATLMQLKYLEFVCYVDRSELAHSFKLVDVATAAGLTNVMKLKVLRVIY